MPSSIDTSRHSCECDCRHCQNNGTGCFAQWAALAGDTEAAAFFGPKLVQFLTLQSKECSAKRRFRRRRAAR